ncbi:cupin domain-containing protein [Sphingomonas sp. CGMCC 1.13654]|uniref:Cupin domain-containing protein n=1 Tax=Sphingomonas chungangi TaxID=2683589 RepID=A0A838L786_9SPHN|nr:cupin domain-containing protein [Sphingomonas chungangi]MBA2934790.1 cupin domain-containing protein [Sphingomonas chungangi]MVW58101.1 cupin domain-containing protein [Sphingomonas chungangi]
MPHPILSLSDLVPGPLPDRIAPPEAIRHLYDPRVAPLGPRLGARQLGCSLIALAPGRRGFPFHSHRANEELFVILDGRGEIRIGSERRAIRAGDLIACPAGGPETAHQIINTGDRELSYLAISTRHSPEIAEYPDSGALMAIADYAVGEDGVAQGVRHVCGGQGTLDYWDEA